MSVFYEFRGDFENGKRDPNEPKVIFLLIKTYFSEYLRSERSPAPRRSACFAISYSALFMPLCFIVDQALQNTISLVKNGQFKLAVQLYGLYTTLIPRFNVRNKCLVTFSPVRPCRAYRINKFGFLSLMANNTFVTIYPRSACPLSHCSFNCVYLYNKNVVITLVSSEHVNIDAHVRYGITLCHRTLTY